MHTCGACEQKKRAEERLAGVAGRNGDGAKERASKDELAQALRDNILSKVNTSSERDGFAAESMCIVSRRWTW